MKTLLVAAVLLLALGCSDANLDLEVTPTPEVLRVTLGGKQPDTWVSLQREEKEIQAELDDVLDRLEAAGYERRGELGPILGGNYAKLIKTWPWPIQTQVVRLQKDLGSVRAELLMMNSPTPIFQPFVAECEKSREEAYLATATALPLDGVDFLLAELRRRPGWEEHGPSCESRFLSFSPIQ